MFFPLITAFLLNAALQIFGSKAIDYARYKDEKKFTDDLLEYSANYFITELLTCGVLKGVDKSKILEYIKPKLSKLWDMLESFIVKHDIQPDGSVVFKRYNGDTATPEEVAIRILKNWYKRQEKKNIKRQFVKNNLQKNPKRFIINNKEYRQIWLSDQEYAEVHSAFTTYIMQNKYTEPTLIRCYGDYIYTAVLEEVDGQLLPIFVDKVIIKGVKK